jgi:hypothetical protein
MASSPRSPGMAAENAVTSGFFDSASMKSAIAGRWTSARSLIFSPASRMWSSMV